VSRPSSDSAPAAPAGSASPSAAPGDAEAKSTPKLSRWSLGRKVRVRIGAQQLQVEAVVGKAPGRVLAGVAQGYGSAPGEGATQTVPTDLAQAVESLGPALAALAAKLGDASGLRGAPCEVVIDDSWMLYDVVRADLRGLSPRAADALIGASLADVAGVTESELSSRWQPQGTSAYTLACGLPANALPVLQEALKALGLRCASVEGEFVRQYNRYRERLEPKRTVIALVRDAGTQLAVMIDGVLMSMSFEYGVAAPKELEIRGRSLLRLTGVAGGDGAVRFYALTPPGFKAPEPWVCLPLAA
jgi:hypothetical protein